MIVKICGQCTREFEADSNTRKYCSTDCVRLAHPMKHNKYAFREDSGRWAMHKRANKLKPPAPCERCGGPGQVVHHKDENPRNNTLDNLERLCRACHINHHRHQLLAARAVHV